MKKICSTLLLSILFASCNTHHIQVSKAFVDKTNLASTFARSPDPMQQNPPVGEKLYIRWNVPFSRKPENCKLVLSVIYKDLTEEVQQFPVSSRFGIVSFSLVSQKYKEKNGFQAYKAELLDENNQVIDKWQHQMWVNLIK
jgi:hypothetical protein